MPFDAQLVLATASRSATAGICSSTASTVCAMRRENGSASCRSIAGRTGARFLVRSRCARAAAITEPATRRRPPGAPTRSSPRPGPPMEASPTPTPTQQQLLHRQNRTGWPLPSTAMSVRRPGPAPKRTGRPGKERPVLKTVSRREGSPLTLAGPWSATLSQEQRFVARAMISTFVKSI